MILAFRKCKENQPWLPPAQTGKIVMEGKEKQPLAWFPAQEFLKQIMFKIALADILVLTKDMVKLRFEEGDVGH